MNDHCLEKLCGIAAAAGIIGVGTALAAPVAVGVVEAVIGSTGLAVAVRSQHRADFRRAFSAIKQQVESEYRSWIKEKYDRTSWYIVVNIENALAELDGVIEQCVPAPQEIARAGVNGPALATLVLEKAAAANPAVFGPETGNPAAREILSTIIERTFELVRSHAEYAARLRSYIDEEELRRLAAIERGVEAVREGQQQLPDAIVSRLVAALDARGATQRAEQAGLERQAIIRIAQRLKPDEILDFEQALAELENAVKIALDVIARGERRSNLDEFVDAVLAEVAERTKTGEFDDAAQAVDDALVELDRREAEQHDAFRRSRVALLEAGLQQDILRRDPAGAARRIEAVVAAEDPGEVPSWAPAFRQRYDAFYEEGEAKGINLSLSIAIALARRMLLTARDIEERGAAGNLLGIALRALGERESGTARLEEAVAAYRAALAEYTRDRVPLQWAITQNNLGNALWRLGERESGTAQLEEAVAAYRAALEEWTRERVPLDWATAQNNLGTALWRLGERETGTARLEEAVAAFRAALAEWTRERVPLDWAMTQNNLGNALSRLGERETGTARLEEAVAAYRAALEEWTRDRVPLQWAMTQNNLGNALWRLGERESGTAQLEEAVAAYRAALEEWTRERVPLDWAMTQNNLGTALWRLGERESGTARLEEAVAACRAALEEWTRERVPLDWAMTQNNLGNALSRLGERESGTAHLEEAVAAYRAALAERTRERVPLDWAMTQTNLGTALWKLGARESGTARLEEAVAAYRAALAERTRERVPLDWAMTQNNLGLALWRLGERESGTARLEEAVAAYAACLEVVATVWPAEWVQQVRANRDETQAELDRRQVRK